MARKFDALIAGGGLAGLSAATVLARAGLKVAVLERGAFPGAKNVMGGVLYRQPVEEVFPEFWRRAPLERPVIQQSAWVLGKNGAVVTGIRDHHWGQEPAYAYTVLRAKFDKWLGKETAAAGALIIPETVVLDVIKKDGRVVGLKTDREDGDLYADVVIAADGISSQVAKKAGLKEEWKTEQLSVTVKEIIALSSEKIEDRFNVRSGMGATIELVGEATAGIMGICFIYTNRDSLSVGSGTVFSEMIKARKNPNDLLEIFKSHPAVAPLLEGGETREYMAHLIPEGGYQAVPRVYGDGLLVVGDAAGLVNAYHREGSNMAILSGKYAAETILEAHKKGDFSSATLRMYKDKLDASFIMKDLKKYGRAGDYLLKRPHFFRDYPELAIRAVSEFMTVDSVPKRTKQWKIIKMVLSTRSIWGLIKDAIGIIRRVW